MAGVDSGVAAGAEVRSVDVQAELPLPTSDTWALEEEHRARATARYYSNKFYSQVGTYIDLLCQKENKGLKVALVATKVDQEADEDKKKQFSAILQRAKDHISHLQMEHPVYLVNEVLRTSAKELTRDSMMELYRKMATLMASSELPHPPKKHVPKIWFEWLENLRQKLMCKISELPPLPQSLESSDSSSVTAEEVSKLKALQQIASEPNLLYIQQQKRDDDRNQRHARGEPSSSSKTVIPEKEKDKESDKRKKIRQKYPK